MKQTINWTEDAGRIYLLINSRRCGYYRRASISGGFRVVSREGGYNEDTVEKEADARGWLLRKAGVSV